MNETFNIDRSVDLVKIRDDLVFDRLLLLIDEVGLVDVVRTIARICRAKADQAERAMPKIAKQWRADARLLEEIE